MGMKHYHLINIHEGQSGGSKPKTYNEQTRKTETHANSNSFINFIHTHLH